MDRMPPNRPRGRLIKKIQGQEAYCTRKPPSTGPPKGPSNAGMVMKLNTLTIWARGKDFNTVSRPTGTSSAPPAPCSAREATRAVRLEDKAQNSEPRLNRIMAARNTRRVPKRSATQPEAGMSTAVVSM